MTPLTRRALLATGAVALSTALVTPALALDVPEGAPPALREDKGYVTNLERALFNGPLDQARAFLQNPKTGVLAHTKPTPEIPAVARLEALKGAFPETGALRRVHLKDGHSVIERVIESNARIFSYQIWGGTAPAARAIDHIRGTFTYTALSASQTRVDWTYEMAPSNVITRPFVRRFLNRNIQPFMASGLQGAAAAFNKDRTS